MNPKKWVIGNWKMNGSLAMNRVLLEKLRASLSLDQQVGIGVCPAFPYLAQAGEILAGTGVVLGAQNVSEQAPGAYTGEVAATMLKDIGASFVIIGHSERRACQAETDSLIAKKARAAIDTGLMPVLCVGETREEREAGRTKAVLAGQLDAVLKTLDLARENIIVAYEPRWAIGTGNSATPEMIADVHAYLHDYLECAALGLGGRTPLLYGGSMNASNAATIAAIAHVDGGLIGSASLKAEDFITIYQTVLAANQSCQAESKKKLHEPDLAGLMVATA